MLKAASLIYALVVALLIGLVSSALITYATYHRVEAMQYAQQEQLVRNAHSGLLRIMQQREMGVIDLYGEGTDSVLLEYRTWGAYHLMTSTAHNHRHQYTKTALVGTIDQADIPTGLYVCDYDKPLSVCGDTRIDGRSYLPHAGIKRAYIEGQNYQGEKLVYGPHQKSGRQLPPLNESLLLMPGYLQGIPIEGDSVVMFDAVEQDSICQSFAQATLVLYEAGVLWLSDVNISGHVVLWSDREIIINASAQLQDVVCYAPKVTIHSGFSGQVHVGATQQITIEENVVLEYPSSLRVQHIRRQNNEPSLVLGKNSAVNGVVLITVQHANRKHQPLLKIEEATLTGQIYVQGLVQLQGTVAGSLYCEKLVLTTSSSTYENHLLNGRINPFERSPHFVGADLLAKQQKMGVAKWL